MQAFILAAILATGLHTVTSNEVMIAIEGTGTGGGQHYAQAHATMTWVEEPECVVMQARDAYQEPLPHWRVRVVGYVYGGGWNFIDIWGGSGRLVRCWHTSGHLYPRFNSLVIVDGHVPSLGRVAVSAIIIPVQGG